MLDTRMIKGLAIKQPFADLVVFHNKVETRTWETKYRGWVLFTSSSAQFTWQEVKLLSSNQLRNVIKKVDWFNDFNKGVALGIGRLIECRLMEKQDEEICFVNFTEGLYCHIYEEVVPIVPFKIKSKLGLFELQQEDINKIEPLYRRDVNSGIFTTT